MILRRIKAHVEKENWFAVGIDFCIVVIGVFIGIQVANWNEASADQREQRRLLTELKSDLAADIAEIDTVRHAAGIRVKAIENLLASSDNDDQTGLPESEFRYVADGEARDFLASLPAFEPEDTDSYPITVTFIRTLDGNRHTYETLLNINGFGLIEDRGVVRAIQAYYARVDEIRDLEDFVVYSRNEVFEQMHRHGISRISRVSFDDLRNIVQGDAVFAAVLGDVQYSSFNQWEAMGSLQTQAEDLMTLLKDFP